MALMRCPVCRKRISSKSPECPHCGADPAQPHSPAKRGVWWARNTHLFVPALVFLGCTWAYVNAWITGGTPHPFVYTAMVVAVIWYALGRLGTWWD